MPAASCPFTEAAYACEIAAERARGWTVHAVQLGAAISPENKGTIHAISDLYRTAERIVPSLEWLRDFCIFAASHSAEFERFREAIECREACRNAERQRASA